MASTNETIEMSLNSYLGSSQSILYHTSSASLYKVFFRVPITADTIEVPSLIYYYLHGRNIDNTDSLILPLYQDNTTKTSSFATMLKKAYNRDTYLGTLQKIVVKGEVFYAAKGIILDKDYKPLMLNTVKFVMNEHRLLGEVIPIVYINPKVYEISNIVTKGIITKAIPHYSTNYSPYPISEKHQIIISDTINDFFVYPDNPDIGSDMDKELMDILRENLNSMISDL